MIIADASKELKRLSNSFYEEGVKLKPTSDNKSAESVVKAAKLSLTKLLDKSIGGTTLTAQLIQVRERSEKSNRAI